MEDHATYESPYAAPGPYPPLLVERQNLAYAQMLLFDMASCKSETTSVTQYIYHSWVLDRRYANAAKTLHGIAVVEMHHMGMLGQLILLLGGDPRYISTQNNRRAVWNGGMVRYAKDLRPAIRDDILLEQAAIETYTKQTKVIKDPYIVAVIERILRDEHYHMELFHQLLEDTEC